MPRGYGSIPTVSGTDGFFVFQLNSYTNSLIPEFYLSEAVFIAYRNGKNVKVRLPIPPLSSCHVPYFTGCNEKSECDGDYLADAHQKRDIRRQTPK